MNGNLARSITATALCLSAAAFASGESGARRENLSPNEIAAAAGAGILLPVIGRLTGSGNTLFHDHARRRELHGGVGGRPLHVSWSGREDGRRDFLRRHSRQTMEADDPGFFRRSFDHFIDAMEKKGSITAAQESDGVLGSMVIVFEAVDPNTWRPATRSPPGRGSSSQFGGTIGVSLNGHPFTGRETTAVAGVLLRHAGRSRSTPQLYSNIFLTNFGQFSGGQFLSSDDTVEISAFSSATG